MLTIGDFAGANAGPAKFPQHCGQQLGEDRPQILIAEANSRSDCLSDPDRLSVLDDDVVNVH